MTVPNLFGPQGGASGVSIGASELDANFAYLLSPIASGSSVARSLQTRFGDVFNVLDYGATAGSGDSTAALQRAYTAASANGGIVFYPPGFFLTSSPILVSSGTVSVGSGTGFASGPGGTCVVSNAAAGDVFTVEGDDATLFERFAIATNFTKAAGTAFIRFEGTAGAGHINKRSKMLHMRLEGGYDSIVWDAATYMNITACDILRYHNIGINCKQTGAADSGQNRIAFCNILDDTGLGSVACLSYNKGGDIIAVGNKFFGSQYGTFMGLNDGPTGTMILANNSYEEQEISCIYISQSVAGKEFGNLVISGNELSILATASPQCEITIAAGSAQWLKNVTIIGNIVNSARSNASYPSFTIQDGNAVIVANNAMNNNGVAGPNAFATGGNATGVKIYGNTATGYPSGVYSTLNSTTRVYDMDGNFADAAALPSLANGSIVYVNNGTPLSNPLTAGGSGARATRINGVWRGD